MRQELKSQSTGYNSTTTSHEQFKKVHQLEKLCNSIESFYLQANASEYIRANNLLLGFLLDHPDYRKSNQDTVNNIVYLLGYQNHFLTELQESSEALNSLTSIVSQLSNNKACKSFKKDIEVYYTVSGYARLINYPIARAESSSIGRKAGKLSRENNIQILRTKDPYLGKVQMYHESILKQVFNSVRESAQIINL